jgi:hypothetical protein
MNGSNNIQLNLSYDLVTFQENIEIDHLPEDRDK